MKYGVGVPLFHFVPCRRQKIVNLLGSENSVLLNAPMKLGQGMMDRGSQGQTTGYEWFWQLGDSIKIVRQRASQELADLAVAPMRPIYRYSPSSIILAKHPEFLPLDIEAAYMK